MVVIVSTPTIPDIVAHHRQHHYWSIVSFDADNHPHLATFFSLSVPHCYHFPLLPMHPLPIHSWLHHRLPWPSSQEPLPYLTLLPFIGDTTVGDTTPGQQSFLTLTIIPYPTMSFFLSLSLRPSFLSFSFLTHASTLHSQLTVTTLQIDEWWFFYSCFSFVHVQNI